MKKAKFGIPGIEEFYGDDGNILDSKTLKYIHKCGGPSRNFHNIPTTPHMLGIDGNIFVKYKNNDDLIKYKKDEIIKV